MNESNSEPKIARERRKRLLSIDFFKGLTIILMVFVNTTRNFTYIPTWSKHAGDFGLTYVDLIAPFFIFMMALNFRTSFQLRLETKGRLHAYWRYVYRYLIFIGLGLMLSLGISESGDLVIQWGTLQVLGASGLLTLPFVELDKKWRILGAVSFLFLHQLILETPMKTVVYDGIEGGFIGALSWGAMMLISTVIAEGIIMYKEDRIKHSLEIFGYWGIILVITGIVFNAITTFNLNFIISRQYMTISYSLVSIGITSILFLLIFYIFEVYGTNHPLLQNENAISILGKNALILFIIHLVMMYISIEYFPENLHVILAILVGATNIIIIWIIGYFLNKAEFYIII